MEMHMITTWRVSVQMTAFIPPWIYKVNIVRKRNLSNAVLFIAYTYHYRVKNAHDKNGCARYVNMDSSNCS